MNIRDHYSYEIFSNPFYDDLFPKQQEHNVTQSLSNR